MRTPLPLLVLAPLIIGAPAQAEFLILSDPDAAATQKSGTPAPHQKLKRRPLKTRVSAPEPTVSGFGDQVPLTFAVRQIVPSNFQVAYAERVDGGASVDWKGGQPWRATLADAVRPLGLAVTVNGSKVTILAAPAH
jgi:hypothetical protein